MFSSQNIQSIDWGRSANRGDDQPHHSHRPMTFLPDQYELLDFGAGRKLERFGPYLLDRPCPVAESIEPQLPKSTWLEATARYDRTDGQSGTWTLGGALPASWTIKHGQSSFELKPTDFGHLGVFPEHASQWEWIAANVSHAARPLKLLNLFAYTGGSTLAAAAAGAEDGAKVVAEVVHVDAAKNIVARASHNAQRSQLADAPIRWIAEDATKFVDREVRRGNRYDAVILDPPSYGHGPKGEVWQLADSLAPLLKRCAELTADRLALLLLTCHTPGYGPAELKQYVTAAFPDVLPNTLETGELSILTADRRELPCGGYVRWPS